MDLYEAMQKTFKTLPTDQFVRLDQWARYAAETANPLLSALGKDGHYYKSSPRAYERDSLRRKWAVDSDDDAAQEVKMFCLERLIPLGGVDFSVMKGGFLVVRLNRVGEYFLGYRPDLQLAHGSGAGRVVVQPNFDIVFLGTNHLAEAKLAEHFSPTKATKATPKNPGVPFTITKADCLRAAHKGYSFSQIEAQLTLLTDQPLPKNVATEMAGWFQERRTYRHRQAVLLETQDKITTEMILSKLPEKLTKISDTLVMVNQDRPLTGVEQKMLEKLGIFNGP